MMFEALIVPGVACILLVFLLSGINCLQSVALRLGRMTLRLGKIRMSISGFFLCSITIRILTEILSMHRHRTKMEAYNTDNKNMSLAMHDRLRHVNWRVERNFWICIFGIILWIFVIRISSLVNYFRTKEKKQLEELEAIRLRSSLEYIPGESPAGKKAGVDIDETESLPRARYAKIRSNV